MSLPLQMGTKCTVVSQLSASVTGAKPQGWGAVLRLERGSSCLSVCLSVLLKVKLGPMQNVEEFLLVLHRTALINQFQLLKM